MSGAASVRFGCALSPVQAISLNHAAAGAMTEREETQLTDGQRRALSTHKTQEAYEGLREAQRQAHAFRYPKSLPIGLRTNREFHSE